MRIDAGKKKYSNVLKTAFMKSIDGPRLATTKTLIDECPPTRVIGVMHALSDTSEFVSHMLDSGKRVTDIYAKPYSKDKSAVQKIRAMGVRVHELTSYKSIEGTDTLRKNIATEKATDGGTPLSIIDVGGYFAGPLVEISEEEPDLLPNGVLEVTTFGHNRYSDAISKIGTPVVSVARSPLKDVEAVFVGESTWLGLDRVLREVGLSAFGSKLGMVGFGMIGRRVVAAAKDGGAHTTVYDIDPIKCLDARSYKHSVSLSLATLLEENEIVLTSTGGQSIPYESILAHAKNGIILGSAGSRTQEIDITGLEENAIEKTAPSKNLTGYRLPNNKTIYVLKGGTSINFLVGSCPDETMDIVFAEITAGIRAMLEDNLPVGKIHEVETETRRRIAKLWLEKRT